MKRQWGQV